MASRRAFTSGLRAISASASASASVFRPAPAVFARAHAPRQQRPSSRALPAGSRRWYSFSFDDKVPGSRLWGFDDLKAHVGKQGKDGNKVVIVDVREPAELFETGRIPGAINIPITSAIQSLHLPEEDFQELYGFDRPPKDAELLFYCKAGVRARAAANIARQAGYEKVGEYPGSWLDWAANKGPVEKV
ncbi:Thiosulfate sulfurtransferase rdl2, mitochondrial [Neonectria magnoliae]|uniref:Thiosulfate sulfurtransferase rdl2, mitochondrial n=1 Tax=Neonectria magnoliae TaxID=2732573 RepID=A0ABR1HRA3_9HYPO